VTDAEDAKITALKELDQLVGIADAKKTVTELCDTVIHGLLERQAGGGEPLSTNKHMLFLGNPGTGKTTVAKIMARLLKGMGVVATERYCYYENARTALVDGHVGGTAGKATRVINRAVGGVLFLDEVYTLIPGVGGHDYSQEAIDVLLAKSEEIRHDTVIILAGYSDPMGLLLKCNPGLESRFPTRIEFKDYSPTELMEIAERKAVELRMRLGPDVLALLRDRVLIAPLDGNARDVRNLLEKAKTKRNSRLKLSTQLSLEQLQTVTTADIEAAVAELPTFRTE